MLTVVIYPRFDDWRLLGALAPLAKESSLRATDSPLRRRCSSLSSALRSKMVGTQKFLSFIQPRKMPHYQKPSLSHAYGLSYALHGPCTTSQHLSRLENALAFGELRPDIRIGGPPRASDSPA
jgi:hypothetical protein